MSFHSGSVDKGRGRGWAGLSWKEDNNKRWILTFSFWKETWGMAWSFSEVYSFPSEGWWFSESGGWYPLSRLSSQVLGFEQRRHLGIYIPCACSVHGVSSAWRDLPSLTENSRHPSSSSPSTISPLSKCIPPLAASHHLFLSVTSTLEPLWKHFWYWIAISCLYFCLN